MYAAVTRMYRIVLEPGEAGGYVVSVPALPGCFTQGATVEQAIARSRRAVAAHVAGLLPITVALDT